MKNLSLIASLLLTSSVFAGIDLTIRILGVNKKIVYQQKVTADFSNVGELTHSTLENALLQKKLTQYKGSTGGVNSINKMGAQLEVLSDTKMNAYGWCYKIDGLAPDLMPDDYQLTGKETVIDWFFAYAHIDHNTWTSMCTPADHMPKDED